MKKLQMSSFYGKFYSCSECGDQLNYIDTDNVDLCEKCWKKEEDKYENDVRDMQPEN